MCLNKGFGLWSLAHFKEVRTILTMWPFIGNGIQFRTQYFLVVPLGCNKENLGCQCFIKCWIRIKPMPTGIELNINCTFFVVFHDGKNKKNHIQFNIKFLHSNISKTITEHKTLIILQCLDCHAAFLHFRVSFFSIISSYNGRGRI